MVHDITHRELTVDVHAVEDRRAVSLAKENCHQPVLNVLVSIGKANSVVKAASLIHRQREHFIHGCQEGCHILWFYTPERVTGGEVHVLPSTTAYNLGRKMDV